MGLGAGPRQVWEDRHTTARRPEAEAEAERLVERPPAADGSAEEAESGDASRAGAPSPALRPDYSLHV